MVLDGTSELAALKAELRERERELADAHRVARLGTWRWVKATDTVTWSEEVYRIYGCDPSQPPPRHESVRQLMTAAGWELITAAIARAFQTGEPYELELEIVNVQGQARWALCRGEVAERGPDGAVTALCGTVQDITQRKRIELELLDAKRIAGMGTWRMDVPSQTVWWSPEVYALFGADPNGPPLMPPDLHALYLDGSQIELKAAFTRAQVNGEPYLVDSKIRTLDGEERWLCSRGEVSRRGPTGEVIELRGTLQDVTERKNAEMALRQREDRLREVHREAGLGAWTWNVETGEVTWSEEVYRAFGRQPGTPPPSYEEIEDMHSAESMVRLRAAVEAAITHGTPYSVDMELLLADGRRLWMVSRGEVRARDGAGKVTALGGTVQDITERKKTELALRERERELLEAQRIARLGTFRWDAKTGAVNWSDEVYRAFGVDPGQPVPRGDAIASLMTPESWEQVSKATFRALEDGTPYFLDIELVEQEGRGRRWVTVRGEGLKDPDGNVRELAGTVQDITERKQTEEALRQREWDLLEAQRIAEIGSWRWVAATDERTWSEQLYRLFEMEQGSAVPRGDEHERLFMPGQWAEIEAGLNRIAVEGSTFSYEGQLAVPSGAVRWVLLQAEAVRNERGELTEIRGTMRDMTERKLQVDTIARSEARYRSLVSATTDIVWIAGPDGAQRGDIPGWRAYSGLGMEEIRGFGWAQTIHPDDREYTLAAWEQAVATGGVFEVRHRLRRWDGEYRHFEARAVASKDSEGKIVEWVGMHTDIHEKMTAEAALRDTQSRFQSMYDANLMGICYPDRHGAFSDGNDEFLRITGYSREELKAGKVRWDAMTPPEYAELDRLHIAEAAERGSCSPYEKEYIRKDGRRVPILCGYALLEGSTDEYIGFITDLTAQKEVERAVREQEKRFRELAESLPELVWESGADGMVTYFNASFAVFTGLSPENATGREMFDMVHPEDRERTVAKWRKSIATGEPYENELRMLRHDGAYRTFLARAKPVRNAQGAVERWLGTATDIHDQKLAEEVVRRTEKLAATGRLAASMAHEINNPLESVTNSLYLALQDESLGEETRMFLRTADAELKRVAHVTTQTLRFHRQSRLPAKEDLGILLESALALFELRFASAGVTVNREYRDGEPLLCCGDEIRQVFANLLSNALDATRTGGRVRVRITRSRDWSGERGEGMRVTIGDTGHGVPMELRKKIFEPFMTTKDTTGTGLGLWVSTGIVQKHGGTMRLSSAVGRGTVFSVFLPLEGPIALAG